MSFRVGRSLRIGSNSFSKEGTVDTDGDRTLAKVVEAAKTGTLTVRTDGTTGTLTMTGGHGITTGSIIDIYWTNTDGTYGVQHSVTVGTVATNSVPFSGGAGDDLPLAATAIRAMNRVEDASVTIDGDTVVGIGMKCSGAPAVIVLIDDADGVALTKVLSVPNESFIWDSQDGSTNPIAGDTIAKIRMSQGDSGQSRTPVCSFAHS